MSRRVLFHLPSDEFCRNDVGRGLQQRALIDAEPGDSVLLHAPDVSEQAVHEEHTWLTRMGLSTSDRDLFLIDRTQVRRLGSPLPLAHHAVDALLADRPVHVHSPIALDVILLTLAKTWRFRFTGFASLVEWHMNRQTSGHMSRDNSRPFPATDGALPRDVMHWKKPIKNTRGSVEFAMQDGHVTLLCLLTEHMGVFSHADACSGIPEDVEQSICTRIRLLLEQKFTFIGSVRGHMDFLVQTDDLLLGEVDFSQTNRAYAVHALQRLFGKPVPFLVNEFHIPQSWNGETLEQHFNSVLFHEGGWAGFIPFCFLPQREFCCGITFAQTPDDLSLLRKDVRALQSSTVSH